MRSAWIKTICLSLALVAPAAVAQTAEENLKTGQEFLAKVEKQPGVVKLPSGSRA